MSDRKKRVLSLLLCIMLVFTFVSGSTVQSDAAAAAIFIEAPAIFGAFMAAFGYSNMTAEEVEIAFNKVPIVQQAIFNTAMAASILRSGGMAEIDLKKTSTATELSDFYDWYIENLDSGFSYTVASGTAGHQQWPDGLPESPFLTSEYPYQVIIPWESTYKLYASVNPFYYSGGKLYSGCTRPYYKLISNAWVDPYYVNATYGLEYAPVQTNNNIMTANGESVVYAKSTTDGEVVDLAPLPNLTMTKNPDSEAAKNATFAVPVVPNAGTANDVPVNNTAENPVTLEQVLNGIGGLANFLLAGGKITLADGTVVEGSVSTAINTAEGAWEESYPSSTAEPWTFDIPILGDILKLLVRLYNAIIAQAGFSLDGILDNALAQMTERIGLDAFQRSFDAFDNMQTGYGQAPKIYINLHDLTETAQNVGSFGNGFADADTLLIDFAKLEEIEFMNMTLIELIRAMMSLAMVSITIFYVHRKIEPSTII